MPESPLITFGIIVLNGEPFLRYCLRALYPYAHEIIVVEGAAPGAADVATPDGHSTDGTLETLRQFKAEEDPDDKLIVIMRNGFWSEKDEMSQAYATRATGNYLWQVDSDEFYKDEDIERVIALMRDDPDITAISFKMITFWGGFDYWCDSWYLKSGAEIYHRLFKWGPGYTYITHRPPTVHDEQGLDLRERKWIDGYTLAREHGVQMYHYSLVFPHQVSNKATYYAASQLIPGVNDWAEDVYLHLKRPFRVHNIFIYPGWLERFTGAHPAQIDRMRTDIGEGRVVARLRRTEDVERLLQSPWYRLQRLWYRHAPKVVRRWFYRTPQMIIRGLKRRIRSTLQN